MRNALTHTPTIVLTMGDPAGIGPEVVLRALADPELAPLARWIVVGDSRVLALTERSLGQGLSGAGLRDIQELGSMDGFAFGKLDARCGAAAVAYVRAATEMCL